MKTVHGVSNSGYCSRELKRKNDRKAEKCPKLNNLVRTQIAKRESIFMLDTVKIMKTICFLADVHQCVIAHCVVHM